MTLGMSPAEHPDDVVLDLRDSAAVLESLGDVRPSTIVHGAARVGGTGIIAVNRAIDESVCRVAVRIGAPHVVQLSSGAVYGTSRPGARKEDDPLQGSSDYAVSKIAGESRFAALVQEGVAVTTLRLFNVAGPAFPDSLVSRLLVANAREPVMIVAADAFVRDYIHQSDVVDVLAAATVRGAMGPQTVMNVAAGAPVSTRALISRLGVDPAGIIERPGDFSSNWADVERLTAAFGIRPRANPSPSWGSEHLGRC